MGGSYIASRVVIQHHGVKGMKWGRRKADSSSGGSASNHQSEDSARFQSNMSKVNQHGVKAMSNRELQDMITRMNLVQQYSNLTSGGNSKSAIDRGHDAVKKALAIQKTLENVQKTMNSPMMKGVKLAFKAAKVANSPYTAPVKFAVRQLTS
jgi:hypothetical protein